MAIRKVRKLTEDDLRAVLEHFDSGVLSFGAHTADEGQYCALECASIAKQIVKQNKNSHVLKNFDIDDNKMESIFTDEPERLGIPDLRCLNDAQWGSDTARTNALLPVLAALSNYEDWSKKRQTVFTRLVAEGFVTEIFPLLNGTHYYGYTTSKKVLKPFRRMCDEAVGIDDYVKVINAYYAGPPSKQSEIVTFPALPSVKDLTIDYLLSEDFNDEVFRHLTQTSHAKRHSDKVRNNRLRAVCDMLHNAAIMAQVFSR